MWNDFKYSKKFTRIIIFCFSLILLYFSSVVPCLSDNAYAKSSENELEEEFADNVDNILSGIESDELNDYLNNDFDLEFFKVNSFKEQAINHVDISGNITQSYQTLTPITLIAYEFDEASWEASGIVPSISLEEQVTSLIRENSELTKRISMLQEVNSTLTDDMDDMIDTTAMLLLQIAELHKKIE